MAKKFSSVQDKAPRPGRDDRDDLFSISPPSQFASKSEKNEKISTEEYLPQTASMLIKDMDFELMETFKNIVFTEKVKGDYFITQSKLAIRAIEEFIASYNEEIKERPERLKKTEERLRNRGK